MRNKSLVPWAGLVIAICYAPAAALTLVRDGKPQATIVVAAAALQAKPDETAAKIHAAAEDLQTYLRLISGATVPIVGDDQEPFAPIILVGHSRLSDKEKVVLPSGLTAQRREEEFVIVCRGGRLILAGNDNGPYHGTEYAVSDFLRQLGVRWFMPGDFGQVVPKLATIDVPEMDLRQRPDFIVRNWWVHASNEMLKEERQWKIHNKMNPDEIFAQPGDSSVRDFVADPKLASTRPELFARRVDGSVDPYLPNLTNPEAMQIAADKMIAHFKRRPGLNSIGIAPDDGMPRDFNPQTVKINQGFYDVGGRVGVPTEASISEEWIAFVNEVTRRVNRELPDRIITTNGYANRNTPPQGLRPDANVGIMFAAIWCDALHAFDDPKSWQSMRQGQMLQQWCAICPRVWMYEYDYEMLVSALTPVPITRKLARDVPLLKKWGVIGFNDEARAQWMETGITTNYVRAQLEWNASANVSELLDDFFSKWYGSAAKPAHEFWDDVETAIQETPLLGHEDRILPYVYTPQLMKKLEADLEEAERLAADDTSRLHVRVDRLIYAHLQHYVAMNDAEFAGNFDQAAREADQMMDIRKALMAINPFFCLDNESGYESGVSYWGVTKRAAYYRKLADMIGGKTGTLVVMLPQTARFALDPHDDGRFARWYETQWDDSTWESLLTTKPFYAQGHMDVQGHPWLGVVWYRFDVNVPPAAGKKIMLYCPVVETEAWCWVNGQYVGHRPYRESYERPNEMELDVSGALKPGARNVVAIRVSTGQSAAAAAGGLGSRAFLYAPAR